MELMTEIAYYKEDKKPNCTGCEYLKDKQCGYMDKKNHNGGLVYVPRPDERCKRNKCFENLTILT